MTESVTQNTSSVAPPIRKSVAPSTQQQAKVSRKITSVDEGMKENASSLNSKLEATQEKSTSVLKGLDKELHEAIQTLNDSLARTPTKATITHDEQLNRFLVKIADKESGEIVREIPSEELLRFARHLEKLKGILFDKVI